MDFLTHPETTRIIREALREDIGPGDYTSLSTIPDGLPARATVNGCVFENTLRAGVSAFGSAVALQNSRMECNAFALSGQDFESPFSFDDEGGNWCGCRDDVAACAVATTALQPPRAVGTQ